MTVHINNFGQKLFFKDDGSLWFILNPIYCRSRLECEVVSKYMSINFPDLNYQI